jgi:CHAT domain-containing protein/Tfp pilus assembly protein PilF
MQNIFWITKTLVKSLTICLLLVLPIYVSGQVNPINTSEIDKLSTQFIEAQTDKDREFIIENNQNLTRPLINEVGKKLSVLIRKAEYDRVQALCDFIVRISEKLNYKEGMATGKYLNGEMAANKGDFKQALELFEDSLKLIETSDDKSLIATLLNGIGSVNFSLGNYEQSLEYHHRSLKIREELGDKAGIARSLGNIGLVHNYRGEHAEALDYYQRSLKIREELDDKPGISKSLNNIGILYFFQGNTTQALDSFLKALKLQEALGEKLEIARSLGNIGNIYGMQGNYAQALDYYVKSLKMHEEIGEKFGMARSLGNIGNIHNFQGNFPQAIDYYLKTLKIQEEIGDKAGVSETMGNIGSIYNHQGDYVQALNYYQKSLKLEESAGNKRGIAKSLNDIGSVYRNRGDYAKSLEIYDKAIAIHKEIKDNPSYAYALDGIAEVYLLQKDFQKAIDYSEQAASIASQSGMPDIYYHTLWIQGRAYLDLNKRDLAKRSLLKSISTIEGLRALSAGSESSQQQYFQDKITPYISMVELLIMENDSSQAFSYSERAKGRVLLDVLRSGKANLSKAMTSKEIEQDQAFTSEIASLNTQIARESQKEKPNKSRIDNLKSKLDKVRLEHEAFQTSLYALHPEIKIHRGEIPLFSINDASAIIDRNTAMLEYTIADNATYLFVLTKAQGSDKVDLKTYTINIKKKDLENIIKDFHDKIGSRNLAIRKSAENLYDLLVKPAETQLKGVTKLCIVPDGTLWDLPFQALDKNSSRWMIEDYSIFYAPSLSVLREIWKNPAVPSSAEKTELLAFGNPKIDTSTMEKMKSLYRDELLAPLPHAEKEVAALAAIYGKDRSTVLIGEKAKEGVVKAEANKYRILHFATHGVLDDKNPMYSKLMLTSEDGSKEDGMLEAWEIMRMDLKADMAVLAACETARGKVSAGEGVIGMSWAMFVAGVPTTIVSQWKVDSKSTSSLMIDFHKNIRNKQSKAEALRNAALKLMKSGSTHPYFWAGFVVIGGGQ